MKTIQELRTERTEKAARMGELMQMKKEGQFGDAERAEFDELDGALVTIDDEIRELNFHARNSAGAREVKGTTQRSATQSRSRTMPTTFGDKEDEFQGQSFTRKVIVKALAYLDGVNPVAIAEQRWGKSNPRLVEIIKTDVAGGGTGSGEWGAELAGVDSKYTGDFIEFLYGMTTYDQLPFMEIPENVAIKGQDGEATGYWTEESKAIPVTAMDFSDVELTGKEVNALAVVSNKLLRTSAPSAEMLIRNALGKAIGKRVDQTLWSTTAVSAGAPAGLLNGLTANVSGGVTADDAREDLSGLIKYFSDRFYDVGALRLVTTPTIAMQLYMMRNALGNREFPGVTLKGGELEGFPVHIGNYIGSADLIMLSPGDIYKIGDSGIQVAISREASIEMSDAPTGASDSPTGVSTKVVNMFQSNSTAIKLTRQINFAKRRSTAVAYIGNASYGTVTSV